MPSKKKTQASHARRRMNSRYGVILNDQQFRELNAKLAKGQGEFVYRQSNTRIIRKINFVNQDFYVVYDKTQKQIATFLTKEMVEERFQIDSVREEKEMEKYYVEVNC